jgi:chemotaxis protein CheD
VTSARKGDIFLNAGDFYFGSGNLRIRTLLGTCVAITIWHPARRLGGMCHFLLPTRFRSESGAGATPGFYADEVMELFAVALAASHTRAVEYVVKLFGGGNMFPCQLQASACRKTACTERLREQCSNLGCRNITAARRLLAANSYAVAAEHAGGHGSRQIVFNLGSGDVWVRRGAAMTQVTEAAV